MNQEIDFTRYEIARILGARALQIAMDAPLLLKIEEEELKTIKYDPLKIAQREFDSGVLPISVKRPLPKMGKRKLAKVKDDDVEDKELIEREREEQKEIAESAEEMGFENPDSDEGMEDDSSSE